MFRLVSFLCICIFCGTTNAQNWQLFSLDQLNHYQVDTENPGIRSFECDSVQIKGESVTHFFRRYMGFSDTCYWQNRGMFSYINDDEFLIDSLLYSNDSVIYYFTMDDYPFEFVFKPFAKPGEEWDLSSHLSRKGTCISAGPGDILGVEDSVKTFTLQTALGNVDFILSKTHGLLQFISFSDFFLEVPLGKSFFPYYNLTGFQSISETRGFQMPGFTGYFHLSAGDLLLWKYTFYDMMDLTTQYHRDSLIASSIFPDSVIYTIHRNVHDADAQYIEMETITHSYYKEEYENILKTPAKWHTSRNDGGYEEIVYIDNMNYNINGTDTTIVKEFSTDACVFMQEEVICYVMCLLDASDYNTEYRVSTIEGLTYSSEPYGKELELLGSVIDGVERGSMEIPIGLQNFIESPIYIYPNPTSGVIYLTNGNTIKRIELFNPLGVRIYSAEGSSEIDLSDYQTGPYHLVIHTNTGKVYRQNVILIR